MLRKYNPDGASASPFYSHGVEVTASSKMLFISGQVGQRADGSLGETIVEQTQIVAENLAQVLAGAGMGFSDVVKYTIYLTDPAHFEGFVSAGAPLLVAPPPATTLLYVKALASPAMFIEIEAVAAK